MIESDFGNVPDKPQDLPQASSGPVGGSLNTESTSSGGVPSINPDLESQVSSPKNVAALPKDKEFNVPVTLTAPTPPRRVAITVRDRQEFEDNLDTGNFSPRRVVREIDEERRGETIREVTQSEMDPDPDVRAWKWRDSPLEVPAYEVFESGLTVYPYSVDFGRFAGEEQTFRDYVEEKLPDNAIGVDVGGPGSGVFAGFTEGKFENTYGMTLADHRDDERKASDNARGHDIIPGDFQENWDTLDEQLDGRPVNVWFMRMIGGADLLPQDPYKQFGQLEEAYKRTDDNGQMFIEVPKLMVPLSRPWISRAEQESDGLVQVRWDPRTSGKIIEITKKPNAPEKLPSLTAREVRAAYTRRFGK